MYRVILSDNELLELNRRTGLRLTLPCERDRLEMLRLSHAGWSIPRIAAHLHQHHQTVRRWIKAYLVGGFDALSDLPHGGKVSTLTPEIVASLVEKVSEGERTWTAADMADWLHEHHGIALSTGRVILHVKRAGLVFKRTSRSLKHKQDAEQVASRRATLQMLKGGPEAG